jgi:hypothetical protein
MDKNNTLPYLFLPATEDRQTFTSDDCRHMSFSDFLRETIQMHVLTSTKVSWIDHLPYVNDTGIIACGPMLEQVQCIYVYTDFRRRQLTDAAVIMAIHDNITKQLRFFKGLWDTIQSDIMVWCELMPDLARQEIAYLETIHD